MGTRKDKKVSFRVLGRLSHERVSACVGWPAFFQPGKDSPDWSLALPNHSVHCFLTLDGFEG